VTVEAVTEGNILKRGEMRVLEEEGALSGKTNMNWRRYTEKPSKLQVQTDRNPPLCPTRWQPHPFPLLKYLA
jgi:hypothetical protein